MEIEVNGIDAIIKRLEAYKDRLTNRKKIFLERLAEIGVEKATVEFRNADYQGDNDVNVSPVWIDENTISVKASGKSVLFIEFGSGLIGYGHELAGTFGYGPSTWSDSEQGKHHWNDPKGWYYKHGQKSYGNPPARAMYDASKEMRNKIIEIAREVFFSD